MLVTRPSFSARFLAGFSPNLLVFLLAPLFCQGRLFWELHNAYAAKAQADGKRLVRLNMDETSIQLVPKASRGNLLRFPRSRRRGGGRFRATSTQQRTNLTYAAFITDFPPLQPMLPQFVIGSKLTVFINRTWPKLFRNSPLPIFLIRGKSGWNNAAHMVQMIRVLGAVCRKVAPKAVFLLSFDVANAHLKDEVFQAMHVEGFLPLLIPAKMTWLLQPLDVAVFRAFKQALRVLFHDRFASSAEPRVEVEWFLELLYEVIASVILRNDWQEVFASVGMGFEQQHVSNHIKEQLHVESFAPAVPRRPSAAEFKTVLPRGREVDVNTVLPPLATVPHHSARVGGTMLTVPLSKSRIAALRKNLFPVGERLPGFTYRFWQARLRIASVGSPAAASSASGSSAATWPTLVPTSAASAATTGTPQPKREATPRSPQRSRTPPRRGTAWTASQPSSQRMPMRPRTRSQGFEPSGAS